MVFVKIHESTYRKVIAVCDEDLIGKKYEENKKQLDVRESFFKGEEFKNEEMVSFFKNERAEDSTFNIVGEKSISLAMNAGVINNESVGKVSGIPFALILL